MPDIELHADYDRDGRLTGNRREYRLRNSGRGAIVIANLDRDDARGLYRQPNTGLERSRLDRDMKNKGRRDNDLTRIRLQISPAARRRAGCQWYIVVRSTVADKIGVFDAGGHKLSPVISRTDALRYPINIRSARLTLRLESITIPGSPLNRPLTQERVYQPLTINDSLVRLEVICVDSQRQVTVEDSARFSIAPLIIPSNTAAPRKVLMCAVQENLPSFTDFDAEFRRSRLRIPFELRNDQIDLWVQDQFQVGYTRSINSWMTTILHMPRARENVLSTRFQDNLADFVNKNLAAPGIGLFNDFWERPIPIQTTQNGIRLMSFLDSGRIRLKISSMMQVRRRMLYELERSPRSGDRTLAGRLKRQAQGFVISRRQFADLWRALNESLRRRARQTTNAQIRTGLEEMRRAFSDAFNKVRRDFPLVGRDRICIPDTDSSHVQVYNHTADELAARIWQIHSSENYGGNLEALPPTGRAPLGSLIVGNFTDPSGVTTMDPDLLNFLAAQRVQPVIQIDTSWLFVGHVDEVLCVVPRYTGRRGFSVARASSYLGLQLMDAIINAHKAGLPAGAANQNPYPPGPSVRSMAEGSVPVTRMFRGLSFLHEHPRGAEEKVPPPMLYMNRLRYSQDPQHPTIGNFPYAEGQGTRYYPADFTALEFRYFEQDTGNVSTNETYDPWYLAHIDDNLKQVESNIDILLLPVLYDAVSDVNDLATQDAKTVAFLPNAVNMQVLGRHVFVPKQYGPRMKPHDAVSVIRTVLREMELGRIASRVNVRWIHRRRLDKTRVYVNPAMSNLASLTDVAAQFADGFPGRSQAQVQRMIRRANPGAFTRNGTIVRRARSYGWNELEIPENTVDVLQTYCHAVLESVGLTVHWVDSWLYHLKYGEIHCGTNVIRQPPTRGVPDWWDVQIH